MNPNSESPLFADGAEVEESNAPRHKILIVDDEPQVHQMTKLALKSFLFEGAPVRFISAYSAAEAKKILAQENDIALIFLDVIMENDNAGFEVVEYIRNELDNDIVRIILRTGHPGEIPEIEAIEKYDINDYKEKTELTRSKLYTVTRTGLKTYKDLKTLKLSGIALKDSLRRLRQIDNVKETMLTILAHETRTPINWIMAPASLLELSKNIDDAERESIHMMIQGCEELLSLSERTTFLCDLMNKTNIEKRPGFLKNSLERSIKKYSEKTLEKKLDVKLALEDDLEIGADWNMIDKALEGILDNAIQLTPPGGTINIRSYVEKEMVYCSISDQGKGIDPEWLEKVFEVFVVVDPMEHHKGNGLSLPITREILRLHGGEIKIENNEGPGSTVFFNLPLLV